MPKAPPASTYIGRFAPSPSGPLHTGSLIAALASYLDAKANQGRWYVRMEDLDPPRESPAAASSILASLEQLHLFWDGEVLYQSQRHAAYKSALDFLRERQLVYPCTCSRQSIQANGGIYSGACLGKYGDHENPSTPYALRCKTSTTDIEFTDLLQGKQCQNPARQGDFIIKRKDGFYAYQLAVVVDDAHQNISHVIRGIDLIDSSGKQIYLQSLLDLTTPHYGHIPIITNQQGQKLSKQHFATALDLSNPSQLILTALQYLQQDPTPELSHCNLTDILSWAIANWCPDKLTGLQHLQEFEP